MTPPEGMFTQITVADRHACGLRPWGDVACWGDGYYGSPPWGLFVALSAGRGHTCGLGVDGAAACWGTNDQGQADVPAGTYTAISAGEAHTCALRDTGEVACWGANQEGQASAPPGRFVAVAAGGSGTCGLREDSRVQCWGFGTQWESTSEFVAVDVGRVLGCGLRTDGAAECWDPAGGVAEAPSPAFRFGHGDLDAGPGETCHARADGQLACWRPGAVWQPAPGLFTEVAGGDQFSCARAGHGLVQCWGDNAYGQLDPPAAPLRQITAGRAHGCALQGDNSAACWGWNSNGQAVAPAGAFKDVHAGLVHSCGVTAQGEGRCWGYDGDGQAQVPNPGPHWLAIQAGDRASCGLTFMNFIECWGLASGEPAPTGYVRALAVGNNHSCAIRTDGRLACWGANWEGQSTPPEGTYVAVAAGEMHSCAIRSDGARVCWGAPWAGTPGLAVEPGQLPAARPNEWFHADLSLVAIDSGYVPEQPRYALVAGTLPPDVRLDGEWGVLFGPTHATGRYPITVEGRDANGFVARRDYVIVIDDSAPVIQPMVTGPLGDNGWYTGDVVLDWLVSDPESDLLWTTGCEHNEVLYDATDLRFDCFAESSGGRSERFVEIRRDSRHPHTALLDAQAQGGQVRFEFEGDDTLSGLAGFECRLDDAAFAPCTSPFLAQVASGPHRFEVRAVDMAGNRDPFPRAHDWTADATPPVIDVQVQGAQGGEGWYVGDVQVQWTAHDPESPVHALVGCEFATLASDALGAGFTCTATSAGGTSQRTVTVKRDATAPAIVASAATAPNAAGWYRAAVGVAFACSDALSGVAQCDDAPLSLEGEGTVASPVRLAHDVAGNVGASNVVAVNVDRTAPTLAPAISPSTVLLNGAATATAHASDALSGLAGESCAAPATDAVGARTVACTATDRAGNVAGGDVGYRVVYGFSGFTAPVENLPVLNVAKAGRSIPLRWRVLDALGAPVADLATATVRATAIACPDASEHRINTYGGSNGQLQNLGNGYYRLDWMAASSLRGSCRRLELDLGDGVPRPAQFKFN